MIISIPLLVRMHEKRFVVRALFCEDLCLNGVDEQRVLFTMQSQLQKYCLILQKREEWETIQKIAHDPQMHIERPEFTVEALGTFFRFKIQVIICDETSVQYAIIPFLHKFHIALEQNTPLENQISFHLIRWARREAKRTSKDEVLKQLRRLQSESNYWIYKASVSITDSLTVPKTHNETSGSLYQEGKRNLESVGRSVAFIPSGLDSGTEAGKSIEKLSQFQKILFRSLTGSQRKAILVLGPERIGKTRLITETLKSIDQITNYEQLAPGLFEEKKVKSLCGFQLSPSRIVSGMSQVGEWESRVNAMFAYAQKSDAILWFDQFPALTEAGKHSHGSLSVADLLDHALKQRSFRAIIELTREQLALVQEKKRSLLESFEILPFPLLNKSECIDVYINKVQSLEHTYNCRFDVFVIKLLIHLTESYEPMANRPGTVCRWLEMIARQNANSSRPISHNMVLDMYQEKTGLSLSCFRQVNPAGKQKIIEKMSSRIIGQPKAVEAMADCCIRAQQLFTDPSRPLASFLFLGPTGTGKTESAKQLARWLFGSEKRLIRFDANELTTAYAVSRLIGNVSQEGTLTSAVRLQPFCVLLFDEIEKAHPNLCDLLLQVLGEGRLTDGQGRLVSFSQCMIVMTSNLGAKNAGRFSGFGNANQEDESVYMKAVRDFFRPEWVNRIDKIIPFNPLDHESLKRIAERFIDEIQNREGLVRRKSLLRFSTAAKEWLIGTGHDVQFGARQTLRTLERELSNPISRFFSENLFQNCSIIDIGLKPEEDGERNSEQCAVSSVQLNANANANADEKSNGSSSSLLTSQHLILTGYPIEAPQTEAITQARNAFFQKAAQLPKEDIENRFRNTLNRYRELIDKLFPLIEGRVVDYKNLSPGDSIRLQLSEFLCGLEKQLSENDDGGESNAGLNRCQKLNRRLDERLRSAFVRRNKFSLEDWKKLLTTEYGFMPSFYNLEPVASRGAIEASRLVPLLSSLLDLEFILQDGVLRPQRALVIYFCTSGGMSDFWPQKSTLEDNQRNVPKPDGEKTAKPFPLFQEFYTWSNNNSETENSNDDSLNNNWLPDLTFKPGIDDSDKLERLYYFEVSGWEAIRRLKLLEGTTLYINQESNLLEKAESWFVWEFVSEEETVQQALKRWRNINPGAPPKKWGPAQKIWKGDYENVIETPVIPLIEWSDLTSNVGR